MIGANFPSVGSVTSLLMFIGCFLATSDRDSTRNSVGAKRRIQYIPRYSELKRRAVEFPEVSESQFEKILSLFSEDDIWFVISWCVGEYSYLAERWEVDRHEFCAWLKSCDGWNKSAKVRVQEAYRFSKQFCDIPFIVAYRFFGWIRALQSKVRAQDKEDHRIASVHYRCSDADSHSVNVSHREMDKWKTRYESVGIAMFCFNMQKRVAIYHRLEKYIKGSCDNFCRARSATPPPPWDDECPEFG